MHLATSPGLWRRSGLDGALTGVDWPAVLALAADAAGAEPGADLSVLTDLARDLELGAVQGAAERSRAARGQSASRLAAIQDPAADAPGAFRAVPHDGDIDLSDWTNPTGTLQ